MSSLQRPSQPTQTVSLTLEQVKEALGEVLDALQSPAGSTRLDEARENCGNDLGKVLQLLLPTAVQIQQEVLQTYGFSPDGEGVLRFARLVKSFESQDPEIAAMSSKLKSFFLPPLPLPPHGGLPAPSS
ncbi:protein C10 [Bombina bombina]|uniref:protein C10 n=1 Tax=Bombina bombina TaxID=8345 RepID=UPI00235B2BA9|nr:protein C10 [Bombina bombina]